MKTWKKYKEFLFEGEWHIHTNYTDGKNTIFEICGEAKRLKIPLIAFTEHVRKNILYDFETFLDNIEKARGEFPEIIILSGIEAKVLLDGSLDVCEEVIKQVDYPIFAFHNFLHNKALYLKYLMEAIKNKHVNAWAHPGLFLRMKGVSLDEGELKEVFKLMRKEEVLLEVNGKYELPEKDWIKKALGFGVKIVRGDDAHELKDFERMRNIWW